VGLELLLGPLLGKILPWVVGALAVLGLYIGIKRKGASEEHARHQQATIAAQQAAQQRIDDARDADRAVDEATRARIAKASPPPAPAPPPTGHKPGDRFQFSWLVGIALAGLSGCAAVAAAPTVRIDVPARPVLPACPEPPRPAGTITRSESGGLGVLLTIGDADSLRTFLREAPACWTIRELLLDGHITKLENRLRAVGGAR